MSRFEVKEQLDTLVDTSGENQDFILNLCSLSLKETESRLRADADSDDVRVTAAAAGLAFYRLMLRRSTSAESDEVSAFSAGDISITRNTADIPALLSDAQKYYKETSERLIPLCRDDNFAVANVRIRVDV